MNKVTKLNSTPALIDLLTDAAAILNFLDLRSIIMVAEGAFVQYLRECFGQKKNLTEYFSGKTRSLLHSNKAQRSFFRLQAFAKKIGSKSARKCGASIPDRPHAPWASCNAPKSH